MEGGWYGGHGVGVRRWYALLTTLRNHPPSLPLNQISHAFHTLLGDWTARVWTDDTAVKTPILTTKYHSTYLTGGTWSPTRPGVFFTTKMDGTLDVWDLFYKHNEPTLTVQVCEDREHGALGEMRYCERVWTIKAYEKWGERFKLNFKLKSTFEFELTLRRIRTRSPLPQH